MKWYDPNKSSIYILYLDANNLHGWAMSQYLAYGGFQWFNQKDIDKFDINSIKEDKVDLEYPDELHVLHDYLLPEEKLEISDMLSNHCSEIAKKYGIKVGDVKNLIPNLGNKSKYTVHYRNPQ